MLRLSRLLGRGLRAAANYLAPDVMGEYRAFPHLKVLVPPPEAGEPTAAEELFGRLREGNPRVFPDNVELSTLHDDIKKRWKVNFSMLEEKWRVIFFDFEVSRVIHY